MEQKKDYVETQIEMLTNALKKLLNKILKIKLEGDWEKVVLSESIKDINDLLLMDLIKIKDRFLIQTLTEKNCLTNIQIKILADILYEYLQIPEVNKSFINKAQILYRYYHENEKKTTDFIVFARLTELEERNKKLNESRF